MDKFRSLTKAVKKGGSTTSGGDNQNPNDEMWVVFARSMGTTSLAAAGFLAQLTGMPGEKASKVLDIAAGHGMYGITVARQNRNAEITAVDWPNVLGVARENAKSGGISERYQTRPGSVFETDFGEEYDYVLLTNIFHHFDASTCERLMKRVYTALKPRGRAITLEFVPNEDRVSPPIAAMFSLVMLATTDSGNTYTFSEF